MFFVIHTIDVVLKDLTIKQKDKNNIKGASGFIWDPPCLPSTSRDRTKQNNPSQTQQNIYNVNKICHFSTNNYLNNTA